MRVRVISKMNGGRRPNQGRGTANKHEPGRGKHPRDRVLQIIRVYIYIFYYIYNIYINNIIITIIYINIHIII